MIYYGQWETDRIISQYFPRDKVTGTCIEVGAYDGIKGSNSKYFENLGWNAVCIEPNPYIFPLLKKNRKFCIEEACDNKYGTATLDIFNFKSGIQSSLTSLHTDEKLIEDYKDAIVSIEKQVVKTNKLSSIINRYFLYSIDFISIDTEGTEFRVLLGLDLTSNRPELLVVENNYECKHIRYLMDQFDYKLDQRYKINDFYVRRN